MLTVASAGFAPTGGYDADTLAVFRGITVNSENITIQAGVTDRSRIYFADSSNEDQGAIAYSHTDNRLGFHVNDTSDPGFRIDSNGTGIFGGNNFPLTASIDLAVAAGNSTTLPALGSDSKILFASNNGGSTNIYQTFIAGGGVNHIAVQSTGTVSLTPTTDSTASFTVYDQDNNAIVFVDTTNNELEVIGDIRMSGSLIVSDDEGVTFGAGGDATLVYDEAGEDRVELTGSGASLFIEDGLSLGKFSIRVPDNGNGSPAMSTLNPTSSFIEYMCADADTCDVTMGETSPDGDDVIVIMNAGTNVVDFADTAGVSELNGAFAAGQYDSITLIYSGDRWIELSRSDN